MWSRAHFLFKGYGLHTIVCFTWKGCDFTITLNIIMTPKSTLKQVMWFKKKTQTVVFLLRKFLFKRYLQQSLLQPLFCTKGITLFSTQFVNWVQLLLVHRPLKPLIVSWTPCSVERWQHQAKVAFFNLKMETQVSCDYTEYERLMGLLLLTFFFYLNFFNLDK